MGRNSKIGWTHHTFNAWIGCSHASAGCDNCYAEAMTKRAPHLVFGRNGVKGLPVWGDEAPRRVTSAAYWQNLARWNKKAQELPDECEECGARVDVGPLEIDAVCKKPDALGQPCGGKIRCGVRERVFVNSMSDVFEDWTGEVTGASIPTTLDGLRALLWAHIAECPALDFLLLTKRPENVARMVPPAWLKSWPANVWIGITAENQAMLERRIGFLVEIPAAVRFISHEPALGPLNFGIDHDNTTRPYGMLSCPKCRGWGVLGAGGPDVNGNPIERECKHCAGSGVAVEWLISGGESGVGERIRPCALEWLEADRAQCTAAGMHFFCKQLGSYVVSEERAANSQQELDDLGTGRVFPQDRWLWQMGLSDRKGEDINEFPAHLRVREIPSPERARAA